MSDKFAGRSNTLPPIHKRFDLIWLDTTLSTEAKMVAISIVFRIGSDRNGKAFPSRERIARDWSISDRQVTRGFKQIRKRGFFSSLPKPGGRNIKQWSWKYTDAEITVGVEQLRQQLDAERKSKKTLETAAGNLDQQSTFASNVDHDSTLGTLDRQSRLATSVDQESRHPGLSVQTSVDHQSSRIAKPKSQAKSLHASGQLSNDAGTQGQEARGASQASPQPPSIPDTPSADICGLNGSSELVMTRLREAASATNKDCTDDELRDWAEAAAKTHGPAKTIKGAKDLAAKARAGDLIRNMPKAFHAFVQNARPDHKIKHSISAKPETFDAWLEANASTSRPFKRAFDQLIAGDDGPDLQRARAAWEQLKSSAGA